MPIKAERTDAVPIELLDDYDAWNMRVWAKISTFSMLVASELSEKLNERTYSLLFSDTIMGFFAAIEEGGGPAYENCVYFVSIGTDVYICKHIQANDTLTTQALQLLDIIMEE